MRHCQGLQWGSKTKVIQADLGTFTHILAYSGYFRQAQELFTHTRTFRNPSVLRTLVYSKIRNRGIFRTLSNIYDGACCKNC